MNSRARQLNFFFAFLIFSFLAASNAFGQAKYTAMEGVKSVPTVFDFRIGDPKVALGHLDLIQTMRKDPSMRIDDKPPEIVLVFIGPSVNLVSSQGKVDQQAREAIAKKISAMDDEGVNFEICMATAKALGVSPESILPGIVQVENGWISVIGYQQKGYSMVADF